MVAAPVLQQPHLYTFEEYLELEDKAEHKSEFIDGRIVAMAGGSFEHSRIAGNVTTALNNALEENPCSALTSDLKVRLTRTRASYPDVSVSCDDPQFAANRNDILLNPVIVVEVLSASTEAYDRGEKFFFYRQLPSVQEVVFVAQHRPQVDVFARQSDDTWLFTQAVGPDASIFLRSPGIELPLRAVYRKVEFPPAPEPAPDEDDAQP